MPTRVQAAFLEGAIAYRAPRGSTPGKCSGYQNGDRPRGLHADEGRALPFNRGQGGSSLNESPSKSPRSLIFRCGITRRAMKERVMYGAAMVQPSSFAARSMAL